MLALMCSNRAVVDSLECCLDDLVECFEDFLKKSLIIILVGIGIIVGLLCYLVKMISERTLLNSPRVVPENTTHPRNEVNEEIYGSNLKETVNVLKKLEKNEHMNTDNIDKKKVPLDTYIDKETCPGMNIVNLLTPSSFDERALLEVGLTPCMKQACGCGSNINVYTTSRVPIPSISASSSKHKLSAGLRKRPLNKRNLLPVQMDPKLKQVSCGSTCCLDEPKGGFE